MATFTLQTVVRAPVDETFALSLSVDAHTQSMASSGERAVAGVTEGAMSDGDSVTWRARHFGLTFTMTSRITAYDEPRRFVDEQTSGPFRHWRHEHRFESVAEGTRMVDTVTFSAPFGPFGLLAERLVLRRYMTRLMSQRNAWLAASLEAARRE